MVVMSGDVGDIMLLFATLLPFIFGFLYSVRTKIHVALPKSRDEEGPTFIPQTVLDARAKESIDQEKGKLEKNLKENGGDGGCTASLMKHYILRNDECKEDMIVRGGTWSAWIMKEVTGRDEEMILSLLPKRFGNLVVHIDSIAMTECQGGEDVRDEFADLYAVEGRSLMNPPITIMHMLVNLIAAAVAVGMSKTIYNVLLQWSKLTMGVFFSFWVLTKFIVYDYIYLGSSPTLLHGNIGANRTRVSWEMRAGIILGVARGIASPHMQGSGVYHGHTKPASILLNKSYELRGCDFGLSQLASSYGAKHLIALAPDATSNWICQLTKLHVATVDDVSAQQFVYHGLRILDAHIYAYRWTANMEKFQEQFIMFSSPRPPKVADLEDKVNFMGRGMLCNGILGNLGEVIAIDVISLVYERLVTGRENQQMNESKYPF